MEEAGEGGTAGAPVQPVPDAAGDAVQRAVHLASAAALLSPQLPEEAVRVAVPGRLSAALGRSAAGRSTAGRRLPGSPTLRAPRLPRRAAAPGAVRQPLLADLPESSGQPVGTPATARLSRVQGAHLEHGAARVSAAAARQRRCGAPRGRSAAAGRRRAVRPLARQPRAPYLEHRGAAAQGARARDAAGAAP